MGAVRRGVRAGAIAVGMVVVLAGPALACGGLVGENGTIELVRTTTLSAYTDGVQRYVTAFEFSGEGGEVGSIVPLPDVPTDVVRGGDWTLQRLVEEVRPPTDEEAAGAASADTAAREAEVLLETEVDALDITVLRGGADEVGRWAVDNGFFLTPDAPEMLDFYAARSEIFMAAKFDASRAADLGQGAGDATPIMLTIPNGPALGPAAHPRSRGAGQRRHRGRRVPAHRRPAAVAGGRARARTGTRRARGRDAPRRPALRRRHGVGARADVADVSAARGAGRRAGLRPGGLHRPVRVAHPGRRRGGRAPRGPAGHVFGRDTLVAGRSRSRRRAGRPAPGRWPARGRGSAVPA